MTRRQAAVVSGIFAVAMLLVVGILYASGLSWPLSSEEKNELWGLVPLFGLTAVSIPVLFYLVMRTD